MTDAPSPKNAEQEAEFTRKMILGVLSTLEHKGLLSKGEVDSILRAARQAAYPVSVPRVPGPVGPAAPGTRWVKPGQPPQEMDRTTPVAIPDVRAGAPAPGAAGKTQPEERPQPQEKKLPVIDMELD